MIATWEIMGGTGVKREQTACQMSLAKLNYHRANNLKMMSALLNFVLNPQAWKYRPKERMWLCRIWGLMSGSWPVPVVFSKTVLKRMLSPP
jgi:hypothetical protein